MLYIQIILTLMLALQVLNALGIATMAQVFKAIAKQFGINTPAPKSKDPGGAPSEKGYPPQS